MEIKKSVKKILLSTCVCFTVITALYMLILQITNVSEGSAAVETFRVLLFFVFSFLFSLANGIRRIKGINIALGYVIHYIICVLGFYTCFLLPAKMRTSFIFTGIVIFTIVYLAVMLLISFFSSRIRKKQSENEAYESKFKKK